jgi:uncharacterized protein YndB with AHSA1/START domain
MLVVALSLSLLMNPAEASPRVNAGVLKALQSPAGDAVPTPPRGGETVKAGPNGFAVRRVIAIKASPEKVYGALTHEVGNWWSPEHTYSQDSKNLSIDARPGGCFCEKLPDGGGVAHMTVIAVFPGRMLRMTGALGPLQASGLAGSLTWEVTAAASSTNLVMSYSVGGYMPGGFEKIAAGVDTVLGEQVTRLKAYIETGRPASL